MLQIQDDPSIVKPIFQEMMQNVKKIPIRDREVALNKLLTAYQAYIPKFDEAIKHDRGHNSFMTNFGAHSITLNQVKDLLSNVGRWAEAKEVDTPLAVGLAKSYIQYQPLGLVLVLSAWNYPIYTAIPQVAAAICAGNSVILKPSQLAPHSSRVLKQMFQEHMDSTYYRVVEGRVRVAEAFTQMPFNMICFTGSTNVGRKVAIEAAKNLTPCLLELGGKCPVIIDETAKIDSAVLRVIFGKYFNCGQTCVAGDYVWVHHTKKQQFKTKLIKQITIAFKNKNLLSQGNYGKINHLSHLNRLQSMLQNCGGQILYGGTIEKDKLFMQPTVVDNANMSSDLMKEQIFGPILPIRSYTTLPQLLMNFKTKPLVIYVFSENSHNIEYVRDHTSSGAFVVNDVVVQLLNNHLPFGGVGESGYGRYHGESGVAAFSNPRSLCYTKAFNAYPLSTRFPPYTPHKQRVMTFLLKFGNLTHRKLKSILSLLTLGVVGAIGFHQLKPHL